MKSPSYRIQKLLLARRSFARARCFHKLSTLAILVVFAFMHPDPARTAELIERLPSESIDPVWAQKATEFASEQTLRWTPRQAPGFAGEAAEQRQQATLSGPWRFLPQEPSSVGSEVRLPHAFPPKRAYQSAWYTTQFQLDELPKDRIFILLNRVDLLGIVYLNGQRIGRHAGSYTPFEFEITDTVAQGSNTLSIFVHDRSVAVDGDKAYHQLGPAWLESDYSQGRADKILPGGIDDTPRLELRPQRYVKDVFVKTSTRQQEMQIEFELSAAQSAAKNAVLSFEIFNWADGEKVELSIPDIPLEGKPGTSQTLSVPWQDPKLWSPEHPHLYVLRAKLTSDDSSDILDTRFGFREFWIEGKNFMLNGVPTRLRGESTYRNFRVGTESHREIFERYKSIFGMNACRIHAYMPHGDIILAADEAGVLLINQSAIWSVNVQFYKNGGEHFLQNTKKEFEEWARRDRNSPSVVIWDVENEMLRYDYELHLPWVSQLPGFITPLDDTRPFNFSGSGWFSDSQDMASLHMQEHYTRIMRDWKERGSEPLIMGEFWVGGRMERRIPTSLEFTSEHDRYLEEGEIYRDRILEMREIGVSGVMPFRISQLAFDRYATDENKRTPMRPDAVFAPIKHALQAETVFVWPRQEYTSGAETFQRELIVCNDGETPQAYTVTWGWDDETPQSASLQLLPAEQQRIPVSSPPPRENDEFVVSLSRGERLLASDRLPVSPIDPVTSSLDKTLRVYADADLAQALRDAGLDARSSDQLPSASDAAKLIWVIPEGANNRLLNGRQEEILQFLDTGGSILCLKQEQSPLWFPIKMPFWSAIQTSPHTYSQMGWEGLHKDLFYSKVAPILMPDHPIFSGIENASLQRWDPFDGRVSDDVFVRPSNVDKYESGNWRPLASGTRREHVSLAEFFHGQGTLLACQLNLKDNLQNAQAKRLLDNMLGYLDTKQPHSLARKLQIKGNLTPEQLASELNLSPESLEGAVPGRGDLLIAFEGTDPRDVQEWAAAGGIAIAFSDSLSSAIARVPLSDARPDGYLGTKVGEHPLLAGVNSSLFLNPEPLPVAGHFSEVPEAASPLLQGFTGESFWRLGDAGPILFRMPWGEGEILASSLRPDEDLNASSLELLALVLTNYGTNIKNTEGSPDKIVIKKTVPITVDGLLTEWLEDMEDRFVTPYLHAQPIYLTSESTVEGPPEFDLHLSGISYLLWNEEALHLAGVVFGEERTFETGIGFGNAKSFHQEVRYGEDRISLTVAAGTASARVNGTSLPKELFALAKADSKDLADATRLQFSYILASGKIASVENLVGDTFELKIPWDLLESSPSRQDAKALLTLEAKGSKIQVPANATPTDASNWLDTQLGGGK